MSAAASPQSGLAARLPAASPGDLGESTPRHIDALCELSLIEATHGVLYDQQARLHLAGLCLGQNKRPKRFSGNHIGRDAALLEFNAVVETPR